MEKLMARRASLISRLEYVYHVTWLTLPYLVLMYTAFIYLLLIQSVV